MIVIHIIIYEIYLLKTQVLLLPIYTTIQMSEKNRKFFQRLLKRKSSFMWKSIDETFNVHYKIFKNETKIVRWNKNIRQKLCKAKICFTLLLSLFCIALELFFCIHYYQSLYTPNRNTNKIRKNWKASKQLLGKMGSCVIGMEQNTQFFAVRFNNS